MISAAAAVIATFIISASVASALIVSTMEPGDNDAGVSELQTFLAMDSSVYPEGLVTGFYGDLTVAAVQRFQCKYDIVCSGDVATTGYGRVGPQTLAKIQLLQGAVNLPPTGSPSGADLFAPVLTLPAATIGNTYANISWSTNEPANNSVLYGTSWPFLYASAPSALSSGFNTQGNVTISGLQPNTTYHYVLQSVDASGNVQYGIGNTFKTQ
jgi:peptidoglycan hydrolase-like protein with peptidoglycan-binding domain